MSIPEKPGALQQAALSVHLAASGVTETPALSVRHILEPCEKHGEKPPGEQSWNDDGTKKRDPNGYDHGCDDCRANAEYRLEA